MFSTKTTIKFEVCFEGFKKKNHTHTHKKNNAVKGIKKAAPAIPKGFLGGGYISKEDLQSLKHIIPEQFCFLTLVMGICLLDSPHDATSGLR